MNFLPAPSNYSVDVEAMSTAYASCSLAEQLELLERDLREFVSLVPLELQGEGKLVLERLTALVSAVDTGDVKVNGIVGRQLTDIKRSKIEQLKLGGEIIRKRRGESLSYEQIGKDLGIGADAVRRFCRAYDEASPAEQARMERASIFDTVTQMEQLNATICRELSRLEGADAEHHVKYVSEKRQLIKAAHDLATSNKMSFQRQLEEMKSIVASVLEEMEPAKAKLFMERIRTVGLGSAGITEPAALPTKSTHVK